MRTVLIASLLVTGVAPAVAAELSAVAAPLAAVLDGRTKDAAALDALFHQAVVRDGSIEPTLGELATLAKDPAREPAVRAQAWLAVSHFQWRVGRLKEATDAIEQALALRDDATLALHRARLFEAVGDREQAEAGYARVLGYALEPTLREEVELRRVLLATSSRNIESLVAFARSRDRAFRNRAAVTLAILGHPAQALDLFQVDGDPAQQRRQQLRRAEWALQARDAANAQAAAWAALDGQPLSRDLRYALALLVEAHEIDGSWERLLARLKVREDLGADVTAVQVQVLQRLRRLDDAIALLTRTRPEAMTPLVQRELLRLYADAGRTDEMLARFRTLMAEQPAVIAWPRGLSEHLLEHGDQVGAVAVWRAHVGAVATTGARLAAATEMARMGLDELAVQTADDCLRNDPAHAREAQRFLFEQHLRRGRGDAALAILAAFDRDLPPLADERVQLAADYERVRQPARALEVWAGLAKRPGGLTVEEQMRVAWLYDAVGRRDESYELWKSLWTDHVPEARRRLVEERLLTMGAELGRLGDLAIDIEDRLRRGVASPRERTLLIKLYTTIDDPAAAVDVIHEYFGRGGESVDTQVASLKEQATVYRTLGRTAAFERVTSELLRLDPANAVEYRQSLILSQLERGRTPDVDKLEREVNELKTLDPGATDGFAAAIFQMAGAPGKAIDAFRRALSANPGQAEYYLVLSDLLAKEQRGAEAVAMLQYFAEYAPADDGFVIAVDGLLNRRLGPGSPVLRWAQRRVLERLARHDDKYYLYELSAELGEEMRDTIAYLASLESSLADAGPRRSAVLRELITATAEKTTGRPGVSRADVARNLRHSQRLLALGEEMPPALYVDLGGALLRQGEVDRAQAVFRTAIDRTGDDSVRQDAGDRFAEAGRFAEAAVFYQQALTVNQDNPGLVLKLARLRFRAGDLAAAARLQADAALALAEQQLVYIDRVNAPAAGEEATSGGDSFNYRRHMDPLRNGLLLTLPKSDEDALLARLETRFDQALAGAQVQLQEHPGAPLARLPRLQAISGLVRTVALQLSRYDLAERLDQRLFALLANDDAYVADTLELYRSFGRAVIAQRLAALPGVSVSQRETLKRAVAQSRVIADVDRAIEQAIEGEQFLEAARLATTVGTPAQAVRVFSAWLSQAARMAETPPPKGPPSATSAQTPNTPERVRILALRTAGDRLPPAAFKELCLQVFNGPDVERRAEELLLGRVNGLLGRVETALGRTLLSTERLRALMDGYSAAKLGQLDLAYVSARIPEYDWVSAFVRAVGNPNENSAALRPYLERVLARPVSTPDTDRLLAAFDARYAKATPERLASLLTMDLLFLREVASGASPANTAVIDRMQTRINERQQRVPDAPTVAPRLPRSNTPEGTLDVLLAAVPEADDSLGDAVNAVYRSRVLMGGSDPTFAKLLAVVVARTKETEPGSAYFVTVLALRRQAGEDGADAVKAWLRAVAPRVPSESLALEAAAELAQGAGVTDVERGLRERLFKVAPEKDGSRRRLAQLWRAQDHPVRALQALADLPAAPRPVFFRMDTDLLRMPVTGTPEVRAGEYRRFLQAALAGLPRQPGDLPSGRGRGFFSGAALANVRIDWAPSSAPERNTDALAEFFGATRRAASAPLNPLAAILAAHADEADFAERTRSFLRVIQPQSFDLEGADVLTETVANIAVQESGAEAAFARVDEQIRGGSAGTKEIVLWLELALRCPDATVREASRRAPGVVGALGMTPAFVRIQLARLAARGGDAALAMKIYSLTLAQVTGRRDQSMYFSAKDERSLLSFRGVLGDAQRVLPPVALAELVRVAGGLLKVGGPLEGPDFRPSLQLWLCEFVLQHRVTPFEAPLLIPSIWSQPDERVRYALAKARLGAMDDALATVRFGFDGKPAESPRRYYAQGMQPETPVAPPYHQLVPPPEGRWPGVDAWIGALMSAVDEAVSAGRIPTADAIQLYAVLGVRQQQYGLPGAARTVARAAELYSKGGSGDQTGRTASLLTYAAVTTRAALSASTWDRLTAEPDLAPSVLGPLLPEYAAARGADVARTWALGRVEQTRNEAFLTGVEELLRQAGDATRADDIQRLRDEARQAREELARRDR